MEADKGLIIDDFAEGSGVNVDDVDLAIHLYTPFFEIDEIGAGDEGEFRFDLTVTWPVIESLHFLLFVSFTMDYPSDQLLYQMRQITSMDKL